MRLITMVATKQQLLTNWLKKQIWQLNGPQNGNVWTKHSITDTDTLSSSWHIRRKLSNKWGFYSGTSNYCFPSDEGNIVIALDAIDS